MLDLSFGLAGLLRGWHSRYRERIQAAFAEYRDAEAEGFARMLQGGNLEPLVIEIQADTRTRAAKSGKLFGQ